MADFKALIDQQIANAFNNILKPGNLTVDLTIRFFVSEGDFDAETETSSPVFSDVDGITAVLAKPVFQDVKDHGVSMTDGKLIVPGSFIPQEPNTETDRAVFKNREWNIRKCVGVPGEGVYLIYVNL